MAGKLGTPRHLARFPLLGGASDCLEPNTGVRRRLCDGTHRGFTYSRVSRKNRRSFVQTRTVRTLRPHYAAASSKRLIVEINLEESGLMR